MSIHSNTDLSDGAPQAATTRHGVGQTITGDAQRYEDLYLKTPAMLHSIDSKGCIVRVSDHWLSTLGYERDEVIGRRSTDFLTPESRRFAQEEVLPKFRVDGVCHDIPYEMVRKDGTIINVLLSATSEVDADGKFQRSVAASVDVTDQKRAEEALRQNERRYRAIVKASSDWIWESDADLRLVYVSSHFFQLTGRSPSNIIGQDIGWLLSGMADSDDERTPCDELANRSAFRDLTIELTSSLGQRLIFGVNGHPILDDRGRFCGYCGTGADITERLRAAQRQAEQTRLQSMLDREKERNAVQRQFVSMVSHEFRTPLAIIDGAALQLSRLQERPVEGLQEKRIATIRSAIVRLTSLVERTLSASRIEEGKIEYAPEDCDIQGLLKSVAERQAAVCHHRINLDLQTLPATIKADPKLLDQVLTNLMSNAAKYSPEATEVDVRAWFDDRDVIVEIQDHGVGIPLSEQPQIFQRFFRASTSTGIIGTGLGLHLTKHFVEVHGGNVELRSAEGEGTAVIVRLPINGQRPQAVPDAANDAA